MLQPDDENIACWSGIKRCCTVMRKDGYAAQNVHLILLQQIQGIGLRFRKGDMMPLEYDMLHPESTFGSLSCVT